MPHLNFTSELVMGVEERQASFIISNIDDY